VKIWTKAFWKDAVERIGSTAFQVVGGAIIAAAGFGVLDDWSFWKPVLWTLVLALAKVLAAGFINPNTGASFGTTNPAGIVKAIETQKDIVLEGDRVGPGMPDTVIANAGETVAGKAAVQDTNTPVEVVVPTAA
jgi:hypothetical protein